MTGYITTLAFAAFSLVQIQCCQSKELGPTVSLTINYRYGMPVYHRLEFPTSILQVFIVPFIIKYFQHYDGACLVHHYGAPNQKPTIVFKSADALANVASDVSRGMYESFDIDYRRYLNMTRNWCLTAAEIQQNWVGNVNLNVFRQFNMVGRYSVSDPLDSVAHALAPVLYVYVDCAVDPTASWATWESNAKHFIDQGFDIVMTFDNLTNSQYVQLVSKLGPTENHGVPEPAADALLEQVKKVYRRCGLDNATVCHYVRKDRCGIWKLRQVGDYCFWPECLGCDRSCDIAQQDETPCSVTCGNGTATTQPIQDARVLPIFKYCPEKVIPCTKPACATTGESLEKGVVAPAGKAQPESSTTSGGSAPIKVPIWQAVLCFGVVLGRRAVGDGW